MGMSRSYCTFAVILTGLMLSAPLGAMTPTTDPAATMPTPDLSTPASAAKSFVDALVGGDAATARTAPVSDGDRGDLMSACIDYILQSRKLRTEAVARFGEAVASPFVDMAPQMQDLARQFEVIVNGENAVLVVKTKDGKNSPWAALQKAHGQWKVQTVGGIQTTGKGPESVIQQVQHYAEAIGSVADGVKAGHYADANSAQEDLSKKMGAP
jgi:hypothetical protein